MGKERVYAFDRDRKRNEAEQKQENAAVEPEEHGEESRFDQANTCADRVKEVEFFEDNERARKRAQGAYDQSRNEQREKSDQVHQSHDERHKHVGHKERPGVLTHRCRMDLTFLYEQWSEGDEHNAKPRRKKAIHNDVHEELDKLRRFFFKTQKCKQGNDEWNKQVPAVTEDESRVFAIEGECLVHEGAETRQGCLGCSFVFHRFSAL